MSSKIDASDAAQLEQTETPKGTVLENHGYQVGKTIGSGSYATVKEAISTKHKCKVAIKIISKRKAPDDYLQKFLPREIDVIKYLKHPSLILFYQCIETTNRMYIIMELASKGDLLDAIRTEKRIKEQQAAIWFSQLINGLGYLHNKGVVHRDLKCENLIIDSQNNLKITDFGFARGGMYPSGGQYVLSETYCGSYAYAPPEILMGIPYPPQLADIWSSGVILYVMVFGKLPFDDSNHKELIKQATKRGPIFPDDSDVSDNCKDLISNILVKMSKRILLLNIKYHPWLIKNVPSEDGKTALTEGEEPRKVSQILGASSTKMKLKSSKTSQQTESKSTPKMINSSYKTAVHNKKSSSAYGENIIKYH